MDARHLVENTTVRWPEQTRHLVYASTTATKALYPHYASLKTIMGREEHLKHPVPYHTKYACDTGQTRNKLLEQPVRAVAAAVSQARI